MTTWAGWAEDFLNTAIHGTTPGTITFLHDWAAHADSPKCGNNPIDLTHRVTGSTDCKKFGAGRSRAYQAYANHADAATAFSDQLLTGPYPDIQAAIMSGHPYTFGDIQAVADQLAAWGSSTFSAFYFQAVNPTPPTVKAAHAHGGYADLQRSVNHNMPHALHNAQRLNKAALRSLARARKVSL